MITAKLKQYIQHLRSRKGQGMVEYAFILGFIALAVILSLTRMGTTLATKFTEFADMISP